MYELTDAQKMALARYEMEAARERLFRRTIRNRATVFEEFRRKWLAEEWLAIQLEKLLEETDE